MRPARLPRTRTLLLIVILLVLAALLLAPWPASGSRTADGSHLRQGDSITVAMLALGDSVFHGRVAGGTCFACHRADGKGLPGLAPDLTDGRWLHGDGSLAAIERVIRAGVPKPKQSAAPMAPMGGAKLTEPQLRAVAAYVYRLSKPEHAGSGTLLGPQ